MGKKAKKGNDTTPPEAGGMDTELI